MIDGQQRSTPTKPSTVSRDARTEWRRCARDELTKSYGGRTVVRGVSLEIASGEVVGLLGPNGAGKTTTFYMVVGLTAPDSGRVLLDGADVTDDPMYVRARKGIGYLPQEPSIFRGLTVEQNILAILETLDLDGAHAGPRLRELLAELGLTPLAKSPAYTLSGGERRRVEITRALVISPLFMLLDEPFAGIDPIAVTDIQKIIFHLKERGIGVLITDHNVRETLRITDRAYIVHDGVIFRSGTPGQPGGRRGGEADLPRSRFPIGLRLIEAGRRNGPWRSQQKLHTKLVQKLILTPSLQQAIKLLPMSTLELADLLNQEMVENPLLEEVPTEELQPAEQQQPEKAGSRQASREKTDTWDDTDYEYFFGDYLDDGYRSRTPSRSRSCRRSRTRSRRPARSPITSSGSSRCRPTTTRCKEIGGAIIGNLDDDGYLVASVDEIAAMGDWPVADVEQALQHVQNFDPIGVAARDLQECLWLQLRHLGLEGTPAEKIVTEHLRLLQNHQVPEIARKLGMTIEELKAHIEIIRNLDPKPGSRYNPSQSQYVIPDVYIVKVEDQYVAMLNEDGLPQLRISPVYRRLLDKGGAGTSERRDARLREGQVPLGAVADQVGRSAAEDHPQGRDEHHQFPARVPRSRASSTCGRSCCATSPTTSACTSRRSAAS